MRRSASSSGSTSGGAFFVVAPDINSPEDLRGKTVASPQLGGTQDVALRSWLKDNGLETDTAGGGDVSIAPQANADTLTAFIDGSIAGAWVPEPWATRLVQEGGGKVLVDERDLWPDGPYVTTHLIVATEFLEDHPDVVANLIGAWSPPSTRSRPTPPRRRRRPTPASPRSPTSRSPTRSSPQRGRT